MLTVDRDERGFLRVRETALGAQSTSRTYWYYDMVQRQRNLDGKENGNPTHPVGNETWHWVMAHYLPRLEKLVIRVTPWQSQKIEEFLNQMRAGDLGKAMSVASLIRRTDPQAFAIMDLRPVIDIELEVIK